MRFTPDNCLYMLKQIVVGSSKKNADGSSAADGGFNQDYNLGLNGGVLASSTVTFTTSNNVPIISAAANTTVIATYGFLVPRDYDVNTDKAIIRVLAKSAGTTNTPTLTVASSTTLLGGTIGVAGSTAVSAAISSTLAAYEFDLSNQNLVRDETLSFTLTAGAHTTDAVQIFAVELVYASCLVAFDESFNASGKSVGYDALGNPLR